MTKNYLFIFSLFFIIALTLYACGDDDKDEPDNNNAIIYVNGEKWEISNVNPPRYFGDYDCPMFNNTPFIISCGLRKKDKNEKRLLKNSGLIISITQNTLNPSYLKVGENLVNNEHIQDIDASYLIYDGDDVVEQGEYSTGNSFYVGGGEGGYGELIITELDKQTKRLTLKFNNFSIPETPTDFGYHLNCPKYITIDGTITYKYEGADGFPFP